MLVGELLPTSHNQAEIPPDCSWFSASQGFVHLNPSGCVERVAWVNSFCLFGTSVVEFVPGFAWFRCVIGNGERVVWSYLIWQWITCVFLNAHVRRKCYTVCPASMFSLGLYKLSCSFPMHSFPLPLYGAAFFIHKLSMPQLDLEILGLPLVIKQREFLTVLQLFDWDLWLILTTGCYRWFLGSSIDLRIVIGTFWIPIRIHVEALLECSHKLQTCNYEKGNAASSRHQHM